MTLATRALQSHDLSGEGINSGSHTYFYFDHTKDMEGLPGSGLSSMPGPPPRQHGHERRTIHTIHAAIHFNKANMKEWLWRLNDIRGSCGLKLPDICLTGEETPRKNLTHETCPDRGSNLDPLRDRRACYRLLRIGGRSIFKINHKNCHPGLTEPRPVGRGN